MRRNTLDRNLYESVDDLQRPSRPSLGRRLGTQAGYEEYSRAWVTYVTELELYATNLYDMARRSEDALFGSNPPRLLSRPRTEAYVSVPRVRRHPLPQTLLILQLLLTISFCSTRMHPPWDRHRRLRPG
jgi:hypothetical protein